MKSKVFISLLLAVLMLVTLAAPALAGRPLKEDLTQANGEQGTGKATLAITRDNHVKISVAVKGATADSKYRVRVHDMSLGGKQTVGDFELNKKDNGRMKGTAFSPFTSATTTIRIEVCGWPSSILYFHATFYDLTFD